LVIEIKPLVSIVRQLNGLYGCGCRHTKSHVLAVITCAFQHATGWHAYQFITDQPETVGASRRDHLTICQRPFKCRDCCTDFRVYVRDLGGNRYSISIVSWQDLGGSPLGTGRLHDALFRTDQLLANSYCARHRDLESRYNEEGSGYSKQSQLVAQEFCDSVCHDEVVRAMEQSVRSHA